MNNALRQRLDAGARIVAEGAALAMRMRPPPGGPSGTLKSAQDYLTEADGAVEALIGARLAELFLADGFQGEEGGRQRSGALRWVVDPIDGTSNYARGRERWCVSLGLLDGDEPVAGIVIAPVMGETWLAMRGGGVTLNGAPVRAAPTADLASAMVEVGWGSKQPAEAYPRLMTAIRAEGAMPRSGGSGTLGLADVASGRSDGYVEAYINLWDVAAALCLLAEAGAVVSPFLRDGGLERGIPILAAAPGVAGRLSEVTGVGLR